MVLEGATASSADDSFANDAPSNDIDPYASSSSHSPSTTQTRTANGNSYAIDTTKLPKPFFLFNLSAENDKSMYRTIAENCAHAQQTLQRPLRQEEVDAIGFHFAKSLRIVSYGLPAGSLIGAVYAYRGMKEWTFPFWKPKEGSRFNPNSFGPLKGSLARAMWHGFRFNIYSFIGAIAGTLFFSTYATTVNAVGTGTDPRLHDYIEAVKKKGLEQRSQIQRPVGQRNPVESQEGMLDRQAQNAARRVGAETTYSRGDVQRRVQDYRRQQQEQSDDASPTGGAFERDYEQGGSPADSGLLSDAQTEKRYRRQQAEDEQSAVERDAKANAFSSLGMGGGARQHDSFDSDDASPTASYQSSVSPSRGGGGGSWDRIRKDASSSGPKQSARASAWPSPQQQSQSQSNENSMQREQREGATLGDSFAFSSSDEERQLAKTEAQRDFDARVERERQGGDFSAAGGGASAAPAAGGSVWERLRRS